MSKAPVCLIQPVIDKTQPTPIIVPSIPQATDLASALAAINALGMAVRAIMQALPPLNPQGQGAGGIQGFNAKKSPPNKQGRWNQLKRTTEQVKVTNPNDPTQFVIVERINSLTMQDSKTGETWVWTR